MDVGEKKKRINTLHLHQNRGDNTCLCLSRRTIFIHYVYYCSIPQLSYKSSSSAIMTHWTLLYIKSFKKYTGKSFHYFPQKYRLCSHAPGGQSTCFFSQHELLFTQKQIKRGTLVDRMPLMAWIHFFFFCMIDKMPVLSLPASLCQVKTWAVLQPQQDQESLHSC